MRLALFKSPSGTIAAYEQDFGQSMVESCKYTRFSDYMEVEFPMLAPEIVIEWQLKALDAAEQELREKFQLKLNELAEARARLLSLTHEAQS